jgi:hypothetical protein
MIAVRLKGEGNPFLGILQKRQTKCYFNNTAKTVQQQRNDQQKNCTTTTTTNKTRPACFSSSLSRLFFLVRV